MTDPMLTYAQLAARWQVAPRTVEKWARLRKFPVVYLGKSPRVFASAAAAFEASRVRPAFVETTKARRVS